MFPTGLLTLNTLPFLMIHFIAGSGFARSGLFAIGQNLHRCCSIEERIVFCQYFGNCIYRVFDWKCDSHISIGYYSGGTRCDVLIPVSPQCNPYNSLISYFHTDKMFQRKYLPDTCCLHARFLGLKMETCFDFQHSSNGQFFVALTC